MPALTSDTILELATRAADVAAIDGGLVASITMGEMADGSGRAFALVETQDNGLEQEYRISSPAPHGRPSWTWTFDRWLTEVRIGDGWMLLDEEAAAAREP